MMDGYEVAERLRGLPAARDARLVALTGHGLPGDHAAADRAGFAAHLTKPVDLERLVSVIEEVKGPSADQAILAGPWRLR